MQSHGPKRFYTPHSLESWFEKLSADWAESFTAVNLVLGPTLDDVLLRQSAEVARAHGDDQTWLLLSNVSLDAQRCRRWSAALAKYAIRKRPENAFVLRKWIDKWAPRADAAVAGLAKILAEAPDRPQPETETIDSARAARTAFHAALELPPP